MTKKAEPMGAWFIEQRTRSLATIYLTRRDDVVVSEAPAGSGLDLLVTVKTRKAATDRKFGVVLRGRKTTLTVTEANDILQPSLNALNEHEFPYPVCLFFFQMVNDEGFYRWVVEPSVTTEGVPRLQTSETPACQHLDTQAIHAIVEAVSAWYDALQMPPQNGHSRQRRKSGIEVLHGILDAEAAHVSRYSRTPKLLKLPIQQAYELAKLGREYLGDLSGQIVKNGVQVLEESGLLGMHVLLVNDQPEFSLE